MDEHTLNDLLECSVCLERLDTTSKVLPCQHTFCRKCLEIIVTSHSELRCPECRILVDTKIDDLPPNVLLMRILEGMKHASTIHANDKQKNPNFSFEHLSIVNKKSDESTNDTQNLAITEASNHILGTNTEDAASTKNVFRQEQPHREMMKTIRENCPRAEQQIIKRIDQINVDRPLNLIRHSIQAGLTQISNKKFPNAISSLTAPHAKALYDFESRETGDLSFVKGDKITLHRIVDANWFYGECNGREGVFPGNHVEVLVPLPQPQCKALYDFKMVPNEEEGCLIFRKGAIIQVLRRVDQNWAEGRIGDTIGIFPIAFVEMNTLAKYIIDAPIKASLCGRRIVPATPNEQNPNEFSSESNSTAITSPYSSTTSNSSSTSSTALNSPSSQQPTIQTTSQSSNGNENRFSLSMSADNNGLSQTNRNVKEEAPVQSNNKLKPSETKQLSKSTSNDSTPTSLGNKQNPNCSKYANYRSRQGDSSGNPVPSNAFIALYPYKSQKSDELELKKGAIYYVNEKCQDGWFRGTNRAQKSGVFPGNYVAPLRNYGGHNDIPVISQSDGDGLSNIQKKNQGNSSRPSSNVAPKLPPRSNGSSTSVWSKPIGQHVEAFFGRSQSSLIKRITNIKRSKSPVNQSASSYSMDNPVFEDNAENTNAITTSTSKRNTIHLSHPAHVRSGSCPSQLLQTAPIEMTHNNKADMFGSHRIRGQRERPTLQALRSTAETSRRSKNSEASSSSYHRKSQSLDAATIFTQIASGSSTDSNVQSKRKTYSHNEKFRCIVSYPPNSEFELELLVGDTVYVHKKRDNGWYRGTHARTGKVGLFPSSFVEPDL